MGCGVGRVYQYGSFSDSHGFEFERVNVFHPSYAVNYRPTVSILPTQTLQMGHHLESPNNVR